MGVILFNEPMTRLASMTCSGGYRLFLILVSMLLAMSILGACSKSSPDLFADVYGEWNYAGTGGGHTVVFVPHVGSPRTMLLSKDGDQSFHVEGVWTSFPANYQVRDSSFFQRANCRFLNGRLIEISADGMTLTLVLEGPDGNYDNYQRVPIACN